MHAGPEEIAQAVARLNAGRPVAFPTETVYGLGADAFDAEAVARVFALKGRPASNPLIVHVSGVEMARTVVDHWPKEAGSLAEQFWPGPLSLVLPRDPRVPDIVTASGPTVAVRCPDHPITLAIIESFGRPLVGPSANMSGSVSPTLADHVRETWGEDEVFVLDGGPCRAGIESTVVDLASPEPVLLRRGVIGAHSVSTAIGRPVEEAAPHSPGSTETGPGAGQGSPPVRAPGRLGPHYQPRAPLSVVSGLAELDAILAGASGPVAVLGPPGVAVTVAPPHYALPMPAEAAGYASQLYARIRGADGLGPAKIVVVGPIISDQATADERSVWGAVLERLGRASATG